MVFLSSVLLGWEVFHQEIFTEKVFHWSILRVFLRSFPIGFGGFSPISELFFSAPHGAKKSSALTVFRFYSSVSHWVRRFFYRQISALPQRTPPGLGGWVPSFGFPPRFLIEFRRFFINWSLSIFLCSFHLRFGGFSSISEARVFLLIEKFFLTAYQRILLSTTQATA